VGVRKSVDAQEEAGATSAQHICHD